MNTTTQLPAISFNPPPTVEEILSGGSSLAGMSAVSSFLQCPEASRLHSLGVKRKRAEVEEGPGIWDLEEATDFGSVAHAVRATRIVYGQDTALAYINHLNLTEEARTRMRGLFLVYDSLFPLAEDPFKYIGVEVEVVTDVAAPGYKPILRTVRYDSLIYYAPGGHTTPGAEGIYSFECKTSSRSDQNALSAYMPQRMSHMALWNNNAALVAKYGPMRGVIYDMMIKTKVPQADRHGPFYVSKLQQTRALEYLRLPEQIAFPVLTSATGPAYPRFLHSCWGRFKPCPYVNLCHDNSVGEYEWPQEQ
jgi:hypothetical protein